MQRLEVSGAVRPIYGSSGFKGLIRLSKTLKSVSYVLMYRPISCHISTFVRTATVGIYDKILTGASCKLRVLRTFKLGIVPQLHNRKPLHNLE